MHYLLAILFIFCLVLATLEGIILRHIENKNSWRCLQCGYSFTGEQAEPIREYASCHICEPIVEYEPEWYDEDAETNCIDCKHCESMLEGFGPETIDYGKICRKGRSNLNGFPFKNTKCKLWDMRK